MALCNRKHVQQRIINLQIKMMMVLRGKMPIALMATKTSELKQRCLSHVSRVNPIRQLSPIAKQLWFGYATSINDEVPHQLIVFLDEAKSFASARTWTQIAIFIKCLSTEQAQRSHRRHWASWMLGEYDKLSIRTPMLLDILIQKNSSALETDRIINIIYFFPQTLWSCLLHYDRSLSVLDFSGVYMWRICGTLI